MILIGSAATKFWFKDSRTPEDIDYLVSRHSTLVSNNEYEYHYAITPGLAWILYNEVVVASPEVLLSMKMACVEGDLDKTQKDIEFLVRKNVKPLAELVLRLQEDLKFYCT